ncbi:MAG: polyphosphate kinase 2 [Chloroflexi bacterium]|nr:polyphosphate kinase 2 [Chloroflexota bacterium]MCY3583471.1 polyphosphate kinase 2 [Chloroflexota bacterium]MCY3716733.1 polyphosphate kinase 2 [Chloroflexota bacterium]MDE2651869.1 polyphosphate kinase 2 [Chloroflexota bacterium]MYA94018.1 polyphosphate kinase 2 [Chloroflexota bacterium]
MSQSAKKRRRLKKKFYERELARLQFELVKWQYWIKQQEMRVMITFDGRDAAGKGGTIKRIMEPLQPRDIRLVALGKPSDREQTQWYFQRYVPHLPAAGEIVVFDRSWYNRATVERVMGFCTDKQYWNFLRNAPVFERLLINDGITLLKFWLSVDDEEQERRFQARAANPMRRWKLSPIDIEGRTRWLEFTKAKDVMIEHTDIPESRWRQIESNDKRRLRLNVIRNVLEAIPYEDVIPKPIKLPPRPSQDVHLLRPPRDHHYIVRDYYGDM